MINLKKYQLEIAITFIWLLVVCLINPIGNFPLNDDWCYAKSVKTLYETNQLKLYNWGEMTLVGQIFWGYLFTKVFGFSFTVLRFSSLVLALISFFGLLKILKLIKLPKFLTLFGILLCMFNPILLELSFTFMTDVPFYTVSVFVFYYFLKAIKTNNNRYFILVFLCCALAYSIRQLALVYPLCWFVFSIISQKVTKKSILKSTLPLLAFVVFALVFDFILKTTGVMQERYNSKLYILVQNLLNFNKSQLVYSTNLFLTSLTYLGLFLSPLLLIKLNALSSKFKYIFTPVYSVLAFSILYKYNYILPSLDNIWIDFGVGPFTLYNDVAHFNKSPNPHLPQVCYYGLTLLGVICSTVFFHDIFNVFKELKTKVVILDKTKLFTLITMVIYISPFLIVGVYDRYLLPVFPLAIVFIFSNYKPVLTKSLKIYMVFFSTVLVWFSVCAVHDYLSWNKTRWEIISYLTTKQNVPLDKINGGAEFITWYHFSETEDKWWENVTPVFVITTDVSKKDTIINTLTYRRWLPGKAVLYLVYNKHLDY